jgi:hypothetical protein
LAGIAPAVLRAGREKSRSAIFAASIVKDGAPSLYRLERAATIQINA